jgi:hypothetical protein
MLVKVTGTITSDAGSLAEVYLGTKLTGRVHAIQFTAGTLANTIDLTITGETTGVAILIDSPATDEWYYPRSFANKKTDGALFTDVTEDIYVFEERIKVAAAQCGTEGVTGTIAAYIEIASPY